MLAMDIVATTNSNLQLDFNCSVLMDDDYWRKQTHLCIS